MAFEGARPPCPLPFIKSNGQCEFPRGLDLGIVQRDKTG